MAMIETRQLSGIETIVAPNAARAAEIVAQRFAQLIQEKPHCVLGLATGGTPVETYQRLIKMNGDGEIDFAKVTTFNLDEYVGLAGNHPQSYRTFMNEQLFDHLNIRKDKTFVPDGLANDINAYCQQYEAMIGDAGGIDLQLLGIGYNGHIAFNEPGSPLESRTRQVDLTADTIEKNSRFFHSINEVPRHAITMGIATILDADRIILLATGKGKAKAIEQMLLGPISSSHPASLLRHHDGVTVVVDSDAAQGL